METLEYYKLKDELSARIKDEISKSIGNERDLQQRYIGVGLKVAATGIAAAVLTLGVFGIKSFYEIDSAIKKIPEIINKRANDEVTARFNKNNPVAQYESTLLESAARSIASSIGAQVDRVALDARVTDVIVRALNDQTIRLPIKLSLVSALSTQKVRSVSPAIDQGAIAITQQIAAQNPVNESDLRRSLQYFSYRIPERFVGEVEKIYDAHNGIPEIRLAVGRYAMALQRDTGNLIKKLEKSDDTLLRYQLHIRDLKNGKVKQINRELFEAVFTPALNRSELNRSEDEIGLSDIIGHLNSIDDDNPEIVGQIIEAIQQYAFSRSLSLAVHDDSSDGMSFRFYGPDGKKASTEIDRSDFDTLIQLATAWIKHNLDQSNGEFTDPIKQAMDFWFPRSDSEKATSRKAGAFRLTDVRKVRFVAPDGGETAGDTLANRAVVTTRRVGTEINVILKWDNELGEAKSMPVKAIANLDSDSLNQYGIWRRVTNDDL
jgi:hypothetical protein